MKTNRRDKKNRKLHNGEIQLADGRYRYKYVDELGKSRYVYSTRLVPNDPAVNGKKDESLREKIARIMKDKQDRLAISRGDMTVLALVELYISQKIGVKPSTRLGYKTVVNFLKKDDFGKRKISSVRTSDARAWLINLQKNGRGYSSIHSIRGVLRPAFQLAYEDDFIRKNPFDFELASVIVNDSVMRQAITRKQERLFLDFIRSDVHYNRVYEGVYILFNTGLRISEFVGLTISDIDFDNDGMPQFTVNHGGRELCRVSLSIPGEHNVLNALSAFACSHILGVDIGKIVDTLENFTGIQRRFDILGKTYNNIKIIDDYAHHPTEIKATLSAVRNMKHNNLWCLFQPHTYTRTLALLDDFATAFADADKIVLAEIYAAREKNIYKISSKTLMNKIKESDPAKDVYFFKDFDEIANFVYNNAEEGDLVITMGAGDIYKVGEMILDKDKRF